MPWTTESEPSDTWTAESGVDSSDARQWRLPAGREHLIATVSIAELLVDPEDMTEAVEDIQSGKKAWTIEG